MLTFKMRNKLGKNEKNKQKQHSISKHRIYQRKKNEIRAVVYVPPSAVRTQILLVLQNVSDGILVAPSTHNFFCCDFNIKILR